MLEIKNCLAYFRIKSEFKVEMARTKMKILATIRLLSLEKFFQPDFNILFIKVIII